ncbi:TatD family hydrolase [Cytobacillus suaedae]|nr:TatD family hydrolase [Cytobacillus suaedae]
MIDSHIHLDKYENVDQKIECWQANGVTGVVAVSTDLKSSYQILDLKKRYPTFIFAAIGFHPEQPLPSEKDYLEWKRLVSSERQLLSAIGEVGLPYYTKIISIKPYIEFLEEAMKLGRNEDLPLSLHAVHNQAECVYHMLIQNSVTKAHFHWLKANPSTLHSIIKSGYYVSVTPEVCYRERDQLLVKDVPLHQLLLETDGPWPFNGPFEKKETSPLFIRKMANFIASIKSVTEEDVISQTTNNTKCLYSI